jgi:hypothetical protein
MANAKKPHVDAIIAAAHARLPPADGPNRDARGRFVDASGQRRAKATAAAFDAGVRLTATPPRDPVAEHGQTVVALARGQMVASIARRAAGDPFGI